MTEDEEAAMQALSDAWYKQAYAQTAEWRASLSPAKRLEEDIWAVREWADGADRMICRAVGYSESLKAEAMRNVAQAAELHLKKLS